MTQYTPFLDNVTSHESLVITSYHQNESDIRWCLQKPTEEGDKSHKHFYEMAQIVTGLFIYPTVCFPGVLGNALTIFVLSRRNMHTSTNAFLSALAVADSIKLLNDILYFFVIVFMRTSPTLGNLSYGYLYPYAHFVFNLSACVSSWLTVSVAVERYILVCHPTRARELWSRKCAVLLCTCIYVIMTLLALPSALRYRTIRCVDRETNVSRLDVELTELWRNKSFVTSYIWAQNLMRSIIPLLVLIVLNKCIISALRRTRANRRRNSRHRVTVMMIVVILAFLVCITPDAILSTVFGEGYHEAGYLTKGIREITDSLLAINAAINFLIYCAFNQVFRKSFARICCPHYRQSGWITELDESTYRRLSEAKSNVTSANSSPRRQDTPPTIVSDPSPTGNHANGQAHRSLPGVGHVRGSVDSEHTRHGSCTLDTTRDSSAPRVTRAGSQRRHVMSSVSSEEETRDFSGRGNRLCRGSSGGLKKSRNSIKSNRAKSRQAAKSGSMRMTPIEYIPANEDVSPATRERNVHFESVAKYTEDNDDDDETHSDKLNTSHETTDTNIDASSVHIPLQSDSETKLSLSKTSEESCALNRKENTFVETCDEEKLSKFNHCDGTCLTNPKSDVPLSSNNNEVSFKSSLRNKDSRNARNKKARVLNVSFTSDETDVASTNSSGKAYCANVKFQESAEDGKATDAKNCDGDSYAPLNDSYMCGDILTTDL
ncbi:uncharacterized protein LOC101854961 [Aplysia californica]|uniref:Uncharacterized protein LOC101854961 n=1 Tax=Aplysia californica TaxID=6500 RepID=A0ABM0JW16_APLCA|nr:uncharacterized protein LOC101854961 [Aplysia californica]WJJ60808.1 APGWamide receptor 2 [Aplysia californica]